ncbi:type II toxin-antitoxin system prevent-host-death family antitoxin [Lentilactobacillus sp. IMAU92037]|uniref:type II toxin-antitoxin system Phd/YefM family antitoxin n=1 Tax=Lentilactobacillus dabitei TaxID=2831523 RepID=UPI001C2725B5|nr:type II toxin-antitoxin system prevent-host-death family antitoxin [Lentilactobacillus dabitei]MBU9789336.1 type II toxin-antitoxin system prevent-host-death family antitoxin [Lentilactobacillus dabitei]MBV0930474.1 type II toxin-antitoxin system prevent-host-death family antitoxin [Lentilactobacillus dabitei]
MEATNMTDFRNNIRKYLDKVVDDSDNLTITRPHGRNVVVMSQDDYDNLIENMYVVGNPTNRNHLDKSIEEAKQGNLTKVDLKDL